ncbi:MAG: hypothetical protein HY078_05305 [Elusimicrobia bacterium]|nr:hypothetical protein [Elusimicrobiota bacterium]
MNSTFLSVCMGLIALGIWVGVGFLIYTLVEVRRASIAVEALAYRLGDSLDNFQRATSGMFQFATTMRSGWMKAFEAALGAASTIWKRRERSHSAPDDDENN